MRRALTLAVVVAAGAAPAADASRGDEHGSARRAAHGAFTLRLPAPGHVVFAVIRVDGGARFAKGAVPRPRLVAPKALPKGILAVADVGRLRKNRRVLLAGVVLVNVDRRTTAGRTGKPATVRGTWSPLRYTRPSGTAADDCDAAANPAVCTGSHPRTAGLYGWQTTSLDDYLAFFFHPQVGVTVSLDLGYGSAGAFMQATHAVADPTFSQWGFKLGKRVYTTRPRGNAAVSPYLFVDLRRYFARGSTPAYGPLESCVYVTNNGSTSTENVKVALSGGAGLAGTVAFAGPGLTQTNDVTLGADGTAVTPFTVSSFGTATITATFSPGGTQSVLSYPFTLDAANDVTQSDCTPHR